jgi:hypothetical protein
MTDPYTFHYDMPSQRVSDSEIVVQKQCLDMIAKLFPHTRVAAVPNGQKRTRWQQQQAKREGMSKGFPDLILTGSKFPTSDRSDLFPVVAFVELKAKAAMTPEQKDWLLFLMDCGHNCGVFRSDRTLEAKMRSWGFQ